MNELSWVFGCFAATSATHKNGQMSYGRGLSIELQLLIIQNCPLALCPDFLWKTGPFGALYPEDLGGKGEYIKGSINASKFPNFLPSVQQSLFPNLANNVQLQIRMIADVAIQEWFETRPSARLAYSMTPPRVTSDFHCFAIIMSSGANVDR